LGIELRVVAVLAIWQHEQVSDLWRPVAGRDPRMEEPVLVRAVLQREFRRGVLELAIRSVDRRRRDSRWSSIGVGCIDAL
jgi:hypothetical protein